MLIIAILAAVALPQYQLAVMKSKYTQLIMLADSFKKAQERYVMANGAYTFDFADLDIALPGGWTVESEGKSAYSADRQIHCTLQDGSNKGLTPTIFCSADSMTYYPQITTQERLCFARRTNDKANQVCKSFGGVHRSSNANYHYYTLP